LRIVSLKKGAILFCLISNAVTILEIGTVTVLFSDTSSFFYHPSTQLVYICIDCENKHHASTLYSKVLGQYFASNNKIIISWDKHIYASKQLASNHSATNDGNESVRISSGLNLFTVEQKQSRKI
jgi:hypothetical protein